MSIKVVNDEIAKFLERPDAEVLCVRGRWGVGKTYTWNKQILDAQKSKLVKLPRYSYVSLFGVNSLDELKFAIFENIITLSEGVRTANLETLDAYISKVGSWRKMTKIAQSIPVVRSLVGMDAASLFSFMTIRDQIVCIDDLERRGKNLNVNDVLGLIYYLREKRDCKIALILNEEQLENEAKEEFQKNLEKVVDVSLVYEPSSADSVNIAITNTDETSRNIGDQCIALKITNIRVINRIVRFVNMVKPLLAEYDKQVFEKAVASIVLFAYSHDQPEEAPALDYLRTKTFDEFGLKKKAEASAKELSRTSLLDDYGYGWTDEFDLVLIKGVCDGYFEPVRLKIVAKTVHEKVIAEKADGSFEEAWRPYHDSFSDNQEEVLDGIYASFMKTFNFVTPTNLNGTVTLFKELGRPKQAAEILKFYMENRKENRQFFDLGESHFGDDVKDPDVRAEFFKKTKQAPEKQDISAILLSIKDGWDNDRLLALAATSIEEFRNIFKSHSGAELRRMLANAFQFDRVIDASDVMKKITMRTREALKLIGSESPINARRVRRYGIATEPSKTQAKPNAKSRSPIRAKIV